jgi:glutathione peroxidase-family protein
MKIEINRNEDTFHRVIKYNGHSGSTTEEFIWDFYNQYGIDVIDLFCMAVENHKLGNKSFIAKIRKSFDYDIDFVIICNIDATGPEMKLTFDKVLR